MRRVLSTQHAVQDTSIVYLSYLVRMWQEYPGAPWRASVQSVQSGKVANFASLDALTEFLVSQTENIKTVEPSSGPI